MKIFRRNECWLCWVCIVLILSPGCSLNLNQLDESLSSNEPVQTNDFLSSFGADFSNWPDRIIDDSRDVFLATDNLTALLLAGGGSIALHTTGADNKIATHFERHRVLTNEFVDEGVDMLGNPGSHFGAAGIWYALAVESGDELNKQRAWTMTTALAITGLTTVALKVINHNHTPNDKPLAWPSGHTSSSFAVASVLDEFYGPEIGIPAYAAAGFVGFRMMDSGDHWASDVLFGATLGWVVGHTVAGKHKKLELAGFKVLPYLTAGSDRSTMGLTLVKRF